MFTELLIHTCSVYRPVQEFVTGTYEPTLTKPPTPICATLICRLDPLTGEDLVSVLGQFPMASHQLFWDNFEIRSEDIINWNDLGFTVKDVRNYFDHHREAILEQIR
jgi:hypothetical protein